jgi:hypothetical protein
MMRVVKDNIQIFVSFCKGNTFFVIAQVYVVFYTKYCQYETHKIEGSMSGDNGEKLVWRMLKDGKSGEKSKVICISRKNELPLHRIIGSIF